jgi:two-component system sensor histidine kinase and response regulator WspE
VDTLLHQGRLRSIRVTAPRQAERTRRRVLVVDDSRTVREVERGLLTSRGYVVDVAVDGSDGWNAVRGQVYDLVITDVDMPRMNGIELVRRIKRDPTLKKTPVMIVSYKDREEDRQKGLEAGADAYVTKSAFQETGWVDAVVDLVGEP